MEPTVKIQQGNDFLLKLRPRMIDGTLVSPALITDLVVNVGGSVFEHNIDSDYVTVQVPAGQPLGKYDVTITGKIGDRKIRDCRKELYERVPDGEGIPYAEYVTDFHIIGSTDEELERMKYETEQAKQNYLQAKEAAEQERAEWERKAAALEDVAQETNATSNKEEVLRAIENIPATDLSKVAKEETLNTQSQEIKTAIAKGGGNTSKMAYEAMKRREEHLYEIEYSEIDYEAARNFFKTHFAPINGACTALRKGDIIGRNYDWTYSKEVSFLVRTKAHNGRYASIGMAGSIAALTTDTIGEYSEEFKYMPFRLLDGLNEKGVYANVNMLNNAEGRTLPTTGTVPLIEERERICSAMLVRYILDNFATPQEACEYIRNYVRVYPPYHDGATTDLHFAVSSKDQLYYLCFEHDSGPWRTEVVNVKEQPLPFVMTNFRMWNAFGIYDTATGHYDRFRDPDHEEVEKYGMGIERANLCLDFVRDDMTEQSVLDFMCANLAYTRSYLTTTNPQWLTEFVGQYSQEDLARNSAAEDFERILGIVRQCYAERSRETALTWQTVHSVVYNLDTLIMQIVVQEGNANDALTIDCFKSLLATKEDVDNIDLSSVAQQGDNPNATNTAILAAVGGIEPQPIPTDYAKETTAQAIKTGTDKIGTASDGQPATLFEAIAASGGGSDSGVALIVQRMRAAGVDVPENATLQQVYNKLGQYLPLVAAGCEFTEDVPNLNFGDICYDTNLRKYIKVINAPNSTSLSTFYNLGYNNLEEVYAPNALYYLQTSFRNVSSIKVIYLPEFNGAPNSAFFQNCTKLIKANLLKATNFNEALVFTSVPSLIDLTTGAGFVSNVALASYNPTTAMLDTSSSLCFDTDLQEYGRVFSNNREKWNWCLREHFAANLQDRRELEPYTITFGSAVLANFEQATIDAFANKGWILM